MTVEVLNVSNTYSFSIKAIHKGLLQAADFLTNWLVVWMWSVIECLVRNLAYSLNLFEFVHYCTGSVFFFIIVKSLIVTGSNPFGW